MAKTRLYFNFETIPYTPTTIRGAWDATGTPSTGKLGVTPVGASTTITKTETSTTNDYDILFGRWVSDPLTANVTIDDPIAFMLRASEANAAANAFYHLHVYVTTGNSDTPRGTLLSDYIGSTEFTTTAGGLGASGITPTSVSAQAGDRIVVEVGARLSNVVATSYNIVIAYGGTNAVDVTSGNTTAARPKWIEFDDDIRIAPDPYLSTDNFNDNSIGGQYTNWGTPNTAEASGQYQVTGSVNDGDYFGMDLTGNFDLRGSKVSIKMVDPGLIHANRVVQPVTLGKNANNTLYWEFNNGTLQAWKNVANAYTNVGSPLTLTSIDAADGSIYVQIRHDLTDDKVYWEYSADGVTFTSAYSELASTLFPINGVTVSLGTVGNEGVAPSAGLAKFDDFNIPGSGGGGSTGQIKEWNGSSWVAKPVKAYSGSFTTKPLKHWNGSAFVATTY